MAAVHYSITVSGKVQGVYYRAHTAEKARALGLSGWVMNLDSGQVYIEAEGPEEAVQALVAWCRQGPPRAAVTAVDVQTGEPKGYSGFIIRR